ncbi:MAG: hypothetical protein KF819_01720 [Labilithrix sp.]|nr:hypothetical protein [Labilithrix sp.]
MVWRVAILVAGLAGCGQSAFGRAPEHAPRAAVRVAAPDADDDLREVVMRELVTSFGSMEWSRGEGEEATRVNVLCIGFGDDVDPSDAFMARLADEHRAVKASRCRYDEEGGVVRAEPSGIPAMFLHVEDVRRDGDRAEAKGSYFHDGKAAKEELFVLERRAERWVIASRTTISIAWSRAPLRSRRSSNAGS